MGETSHTGGETSSVGVKRLAGGGGGAKRLKLGQVGAKRLEDGCEASWGAKRLCAKCPGAGLWNSSLGLLEVGHFHGPGTALL